jgi:hypothetical protein
MDFMASAFNKTFVNTKFKAIRENVLFEREKGLMPTTQTFVEKILAVQGHKEHLKELHQRRAKLREDLNMIRDDMYMVLQQIRLVEYGNLAEETINEKRQFVRQCPTSNCKGFLSTQWKCGICSVWVCPECHEIKGYTRDADHTCKPENVETAKLIAKESKPCPNCSVPICKISGCSQMYCTSCHTPWNWNTGKIVTHGAIHNPHFYELQRQNGGQIREHADIPCGGFPLPVVFGRQLKTIIEPVPLKPGSKQAKENASFVQRLTGKLQGLVHMWEVEAVRYRQNIVLDNIELRAKYMMNQITEEKFKQQLQQKEKAVRKKAEYFAILNTLRDVSLDIIAIMMQAKNMNELIKLDQDLIQVWTDADINLGVVATKYNCKKPMLDSYGPIIEPIVT